ncbi:MAG: LysR family transcriptional regulator [Desulfovibrio sp.]|nr:LysR family transcriptional regulator [Desulfovibrio sp.]
MEFKTLFNFLEIARLKNFTAAARSLDLTQPTLSKQIQELESELGARLLIRGKRVTVLTEAGEYLFKKAGEIIELVERTKDGIVHADPQISGNVYIAGGETRTMSVVAKAIKRTREKYPGIKFHLYSGNAEAVAERLEKGVADFGAFVLPANLEKFEYITLPMKDRWGLLLRKDDPLACKERIEPGDLSGVNVICSSQNSANNEINGWMGKNAPRLNIVATYTLLYNAAIMVQESIGAAICLEGIADTSSGSFLCFRPFYPYLEVPIAIAYKKSNLFSSAAMIFQEILYTEIARITS